MSVLPQLILVVVLVIVNAAMAGSEMALVSLRPAQIERLAERGRRGRLLAELARDPNRFLATIQIGITLAGFLASAAAAVALAAPLQEPLSFLGNAAEPVSVVVVTLILAYFTLVFGELAPKRIAMQRAEGWGLLTARPLAVLSTLTRPAVWFLGISTNVAVRLMGGDPTLDREEISEAELRSMVSTREELSEEQRLIVEGAFDIGERSLREIVRPRGDVFVLDHHLDTEAAIHQLAAAGHSRAPVAEDADLERFTGFVHLRDLVGPGEFSVLGRARPLTALPETVSVIDALRAMKTERQPMIVVLNEHGETEGIVTLQDLLEELVGEVYDEADDDLASVIHDEDGVLRLPGRFPMHDLIDLGIELPTGDYTTIAGLVLRELGRIPEGPGDVVEVNGWRIEVLGVKRRAIETVAVSTAEPVIDLGATKHSNGGSSPSSREG